MDPVISFIPASFSIFCLLHLPSSTVSLLIKGDVFYGKEFLQSKTYYHRLWGEYSTTYSDATEAAQWTAPSCNQLQSATDNVVRDGRSILIGRYPPLLPPFTVQYPWAPLASDGNRTSNLPLTSQQPTLPMPPLGVFLLFHCSSVLDSISAWFHFFCSHTGWNGLSLLCLDWKKIS